MTNDRSGMARPILAMGNLHEPFVCTSGPLKGGQQGNLSCAPGEAPEDEGDRPGG